MEHQEPDDIGKRTRPAPSFDHVERGSAYQERAIHDARTKDPFQSADKDTTDWNWSGPSDKISSRQEAKNEKLFVKAVAQLNAKAKIPGVDQLGKVSTAEAIRRIAPFDDDFDHRVAQMKSAYQQAFVSWTSSGEEDTSALERVEVLAEPLIRDIFQTLQDLGIHNTGFLPGYLPSIYMLRSMARINLRNYEGAIDDATEGIHLSVKLTGESCQVESVILLMTRAKSSRKLGFLEQALTDFRGCCAYVRRLSGWDRRPSIGEITMEVLRTLTMIKVRDEATRPHYTEEERIKWKKELGLDEYSQESYTCGNCGATRSDSVTLFRCSGCMKKWYCSKACLTHAWKYKGHKKECKELRANTLFATDAVQEGIVKENKDHGFALSTSFEVIMYDPEKKLYFESLTDHDLICGQH